MASPVLLVAIIIDMSGNQLKTSDNTTFIPDYNHTDGGFICPDGYVVLTVEFDKHYGDYVGLPQPARVNGDSVSYQLDTQTLHCIGGNRYQMHGLPA